MEIHALGKRRHLLHLSGSDCWNWCLKIIRSKGAFKNQVFLLTLSLLALCVDGLSFLRDLPIPLQERNVLKKSGKNLQRLLGEGWFGRYRGRYSA